jgi:hypothetical protein
LHFGPDRQKYYLPEVLLQKLENVPSHDPWTGEVHLVDVDASTGHVLIHFLHTGLYETLKDGIIEDVQDSHSSIVRNEFQKAVLAVEAAKKYGLTGLRELAQAELERRGQDMCLHDAVRAIQEEFMAGPPDEYVWLRDYVSKKVQWTFKHDPSMLTALDFFDSIESPTLTRLLAQIIVGLYSEKVEQLREERTATAAREVEDLNTSTLEGGVFETPYPEAEEAHLAQFQEADAAPSSSTAIGDEAKMLEAESTVVSWGSGSWGSTSFIPKKKKKKKSKVETRYPLPEPPLHAIQLEVGPIPIIAEDATVAAIAPVVHKDPKVEVDPYAGLSKSQAKKLKAKLDTEAKLKEAREQLRIEEIEAAAAAAAEVAEAELKEKEELAAAATAEAEECRKKDNDLWAKLDVASPRVSKKKKGKKAERIAREEKEEKRLREEERIHMQEEAAAVVPGAKDAELNKAGEERATAAIAEASMSAFDATAQTFDSYDDDDCGLRLDHLSRNEGWQNCKPCELYLRKIATKLHAVGPPNVHGFNAID